MKTLRLTNSTKNVILSIATAIMMFTFSSCAQKATFLVSSVVPAARGSVTVRQDNNKNYVIKVKLFNLSESNRLQPSKNCYVVWLVSANNSAQNIGLIKSSTKLLSKKLNASFETVSAVKPTKIFITAEDDASTQYPGTPVVLTTDNL